MALYYYSDAACTIPKKAMSPDFGCPKNACCHLSGSGFMIDIDGNGSDDFGMGLPYSVEVTDQSGSEYGLSFVGAFAQLFKSLG
jgi:hypothetical protein